MRTEHSPEALAWRVDLAGGGVLAYTGDTGPNPAVARLARGADLFVVGEGDVILDFDPHQGDQLSGPLDGVATAGWFV